MSNLEILLVDDDEITNFLSTQVLKTLQIDNIRTASNGQEGIEALKEKCSQIVLLDIKMPILDGFGFLEEKSKTNLCPTTKVIMLSSSNSKEEIEKAKSFETVIGYIEKPLNKETLQNLLDNV